MSALSMLELAVAACGQENMALCFSYNGKNRAVRVESVEGYLVRGYDMASEGYRSFRFDDATRMGGWAFYDITVNG